MRATSVQNQKISQPIYVKKPAIKRAKAVRSRSLSTNTQVRKQISLLLVSLMWWGTLTDAGIDVLEVLELWILFRKFPEAGFLRRQKCTRCSVQKDMEGRLDLRDELTFTIDHGCQTWTTQFTLSL